MLVMRDDVTRSVGIGVSNVVRELGWWQERFGFIKRISLPIRVLGGDHEL